MAIAPVGSETPIRPPLSRGKIISAVDQGVSLMTLPVWAPAGVPASWWTVPWLRSGPTCAESALVLCCRFVEDRFRLRFTVRLNVACCQAGVSAQNTYRGSLAAGPEGPTTTARRRITRRAPGGLETNPCPCASPSTAGGSAPKRRPVLSGFGQGAETHLHYESS